MPGSDCGEISPFPLPLLSGIILALCTTPLELSRLVCFSERRRGEGCHGNWTDLFMHFVAGSRGGGMGVAEIEGDKVSSPAVCHSVRPSAARECFPATLRRLSLAAALPSPAAPLHAGSREGGQGHSRKPPIPPECRAHLSSRHPSCPFLALVAASSGLKHIRRRLVNLA